MDTITIIKGSLNNCRNRIKKMTLYLRRRENYHFIINCRSKGEEIDLQQCAFPNVYWHLFETSLETPNKVLPLVVFPATISANILTKLWTIHEPVQYLFQLWQWQYNPQTNQWYYRPDFTTGNDICRKCIFDEYIRRIEKTLHVGPLIYSDFLIFSEKAIVQRFDRKQSANMSSESSFKQDLKINEPYSTSSQSVESTSKSPGRYLESIPVNMTATFSFPGSLKMNEPSSPKSESNKIPSEIKYHDLSSIPMKSIPDNRIESLFNSSDTKYCARFWSELRMYEESFDRLRVIKASIYRNHEWSCKRMGLRYMSPTRQILYVHLNFLRWTLRSLKKMPSLPK